MISLCIYQDVVVNTMKMIKMLKKYKNKRELAGAQQRCYNSSSQGVGIKAQRLIGLLLEQVCFTAHMG